MDNNSNITPNPEKKNDFLQKLNETLKKIFASIKKIFSTIVSLGKEYGCILLSYIKKNHKTVLRIGIVVVVLIVMLSITHLLTTKPFYYNDRLNDGKIITERISLAPFRAESDLQAYIRQYLIGNDSYQIRLPYSSTGRIIGIYHDTTAANLVISWNPEFYLAWGEGLPPEDTRLFFYSIKKNFPVKTIRYLIDNQSVPILWEDQRLDLGVNLEMITLQKNKK